MILALLVIVAAYFAVILTPVIFDALASWRAARWMRSAHYRARDFGPVSRAAFLDRRAVAWAIADELDEAGVDSDAFYTAVPAPGGGHVNLSAEEFADALLSHPHRLRGEPDPCAPPSPPPRRAVGAVLCALLGAALCVGASGIEQLAYFWVAWMCTMIVRDALGLPQIEAPL